MTTSRKTAAAEMKDRFVAAGIRKGAAVLLHSSIRRTVRELGCTPADILEGLRLAVGDEGTVLLPLFNFEFNDGVPFDIRTSPSRMGALTEAARTHRDAVRTGHPVYSFAAIGAKAGELKGLRNKSAYGPDSPFDWLRKSDGQVAILDLDDQDSMTFYHYVEEEAGVPYRFHKDFTGSYTDEDGVTRQRTFSIFVRDTSQGVETSVNRMGELLWQSGHYSGDRAGEGAGIRVIEAKRLYDAVRSVIDRGQAHEYLYETR